MNEAYHRVDVASKVVERAGVALADLAETETANSAAAANALLGDEADLQGEETVITDELRVIISRTSTSGGRGPCSHWTRGTPTPPVTSAQARAKSSPG